MASGNTMRRVSLRNIMAHKLRLALTVLAVVLGTAFIAGSFMFTNSLSSTFDSAVDNAFTGVDVAVSPKEGETTLAPEIRGKLRADEQVDGVNVRDSETVVVANDESEAFQTGGGQSSLTTWYAPDETIGEPSKLVEGNEPSGADQVVINDSAAEKFGVKVGDKLIVVHPDKKVEVTVAGIVKPAVDQGPSITLQMAADAFVKTYGDPAQLAVSAAEGVSPDELVDHINDTYDVKAESGQKLADELSKQIGSALKFVNYFLIAFGLIALLVGTFIIANTFAMIVAQRTKEFALLRALGASRAQITRSVVVESAVVGVIGSAVGVVVGIGLVAAIKAVMKSQGMELDSSLGLSLSAVLIPLALGTVVTVASAWVPARHAGAVKPVEAMRSTESAAGSPLTVRTIIGAVVFVLGVALCWWGVASGAGTGVRAGLVGGGALGVILGFFLASPALSIPIVSGLGRVIGAPFGSIGRLAATNSRRNPRRAATTAFALTLGVALVTAIGMLGATMKSSVDDAVQEQMRADFLLSGPPQGDFPTPVETVDRAAKTEGVGQTISMAMAPVTIDGQASAQFGPGNAMTTTLDQDPDSLLQLDMQEGDAHFGDDPSFIASADFAKAHGWKVGESYEVAGPGGVKKDKAKLVGVFGSNDVIKSVLLSESAATKVVPKQALNIYLVGVNAKEGYDKEKLRGNLEQSVKDLIVVQVQSAKDYAGQAASAIDQMLNILYALLALAVIIAVLGIINTLTLSVIERRQEIGMMRAVGTHRRQVRTMITLEAVEIALFGAVMGMLIGLGLGWAFIKVLAGEGLSSAIIPWGQLAIMLAGSAVVGVVAAIWPANRAAKTPPLDALAQ